MPDIAAQHGSGVILETPTWRASRDWGARIGYPAAELRHVNQDAVDLLSRVRGGHLGAASSPVVISGCIGPRADAYRPAVRMDEDEAEAYHAGQIDILAATRAGVPAAISFTTETDGRLPDGTSLTNAVAAVDAATGGAPVYYGVNCAHPSHFESALPTGAIGARVRSVRANASRKSHAELDESATLDAGDPIELAGDYVRLRAQHPRISIFGGCCGTDARHVQAIADALLAAADTR